MRQRYLNLPNGITIGRLAAAPVIILLLLFVGNSDSAQDRTLSCLAGIIFALAMGSDLVDGYLARRRGLTSTFGKFLDPLADKLLFLVAMIMMIPLGRIPAWLVAILFIREVTITALRGIAVDEGIVIAASHWGKYKSAFLSSATTGLLLHYPFLGLDWRLVGWLLMLPGLFFSIASGIRYTVGFFRAAADSGQPS